MIIRIYRVLIDPVYRSEFEEKFAKVAEKFVSGREGLVSVTIGKPIESAPTEFAPNVYVLISIWTDIEAVKKFTGENWCQPVIPDQMKKYTGACWLDQFQSF